MRRHYGFCAAPVLASRNAREVGRVTDREPLPIPRELALRLAKLLASVAVRLVRQATVGD